MGVDVRMIGGQLGWAWPGLGGGQLLTLLHAAPGQGVLAHKIMPNGPVVILHHKAQEGQFWHQDPEG